MSKVQRPSGVQSMEQGLPLMLFRMPWTSAVQGLVGSKQAGGVANGAQAGKRRGSVWASSQEGEQPGGGWLPTLSATQGCITAPGHSRSHSHIVVAQSTRVEFPLQFGSRRRVKGAGWVVLQLAQ